MNNEATAFRGDVLGVLASDESADPYELSLIDWDAFWNKDRKDEDWLLEPVLARGKSHALYAPSKGGKSEHALAWAACIAAGLKVLDRPEGAPLDVVYIDLEMTEEDLYERLEAMGFTADIDFSHLHYYLLPNLPNLDTPAGGDAVRNIARRRHAALVVIDTTSRVLGGSENDADTLRAFYMYTCLPLKADGRTLLRLDHSGKDLAKGQRGSSAKNDDVDIVWELTRREGGAMLRATHRRQRWVPETVALVRFDDPLHYERAAESYPPGTYELAAALDELNLPIETTRRAAQEALKAAGRSQRTSVLTAAIRWRKRPQDVSGTTSGTTSQHELGTTLGTTNGPDSGTTSEPSGTTKQADDGFPPSLEGEPSARCPVCQTAPISKYQECCKQCQPEYARLQANGAHA